MDKVFIINELSKCYTQGNDAAFARMLGITPQGLSSWKARNSFDFDILYSKCVDVNPEFLFTGEGPIKKSNQPHIFTEGIAVYGAGVGKRVKERKLQFQFIPLFDTSATASIAQLIPDAKQPIPVDKIYIPNMPKCDGALPISGDSMYPLLKAGDIVLYKFLNDISNIVWGEMYLVSIVHKGDEFFAAKFVQRSEKENWIRLVSHNQHHQAVEFPQESIKAIAHIKASIRYNSSY